MQAILFLLLATFMWGLWGFAEKKAVELAHPLTVQWMYITFYFAALPVLMLLANRIEPVVEPNWDAYKWSLVAGILSLGAILAFLFGLQDVDASIAVSITAAYPVFTLIPSLLTKSEVLTPTKLIGIMIIVIGVALVTR